MKVTNHFCLSKRSYLLQINSRGVTASGGTWRGSDWLKHDHQLNYRFCSIQKPDLSISTAFRPSA